MSLFVTSYLSRLQKTCLLDIERLKLIAKEGEQDETPSCNLSFQNGAKYFFCYADENISHDERELLREIFRNGIMHSFFPKGIEIGITYDSSLEIRRELFIPIDNKIILNINFLSNIVIHVLNLILVDTAIHELVGRNLQKISDQEFQNMSGIIENYKK